jgi:uncharacterized glyoxalase superfamily protein PhnB
MQPNEASANTSGIHEVFPYLRVRGGADAIAFYTRAFGAVEKFRLVEPGGRVGHAEMQIGPIVMMISDEYPEFDIKGPQSLGGTSFSMHLHVDDADAWIARAIAAGANNKAASNRIAARSANRRSRRRQGAL